VKAHKAKAKSSYERYHSDERQRLAQLERQYERYHSDERYRRYLNRRKRRWMQQRPHRMYPNRGNLRYTIEEHEIAMRDDISITEICYLIGRSYKSVDKHRRRGAQKIENKMPEEEREELEIVVLTRVCNVAGCELLADEHQRRCLLHRRRKRAGRCVEEILA
jgi:hypothetical protein